MTVLTICIDLPLSVEGRLRLKDMVADAYRRATYTEGEIGVDTCWPRQPTFRLGTSEPIPFDPDDYPLT